MPEILSSSETNSSGILETTYTEAEVAKYKRDIDREETRARLQTRLEDRAPNLYAALKTVQANLPGAEAMRQRDTQAEELVREAMWEITQVANAKNVKTIQPFTKLPQQVPEITDSARGLTYTQVRRRESLPEDAFRLDVLTPQTGDLGDEYNQLRVELPPTQLYEDCLIVVNSPADLICSSDEIRDQLYQALEANPNPFVQTGLKILYQDIKEKFIPRLENQALSEADFKRSLLAQIDRRLRYYLGNDKDLAQQFNVASYWQGYGNRFDFYLQRDGQFYVADNNLLDDLRNIKVHKTLNLQEYRYGLLPNRTTVAARWIGKGLNRAYAQVVADNTEVRIFIPGSGDREAKRRVDWRAKQRLVFGGSGA